MAIQCLLYDPGGLKSKQDKTTKPLINAALQCMGAHRDEDACLICIVGDQNYILLYILKVLQYIATNGDFLFEM